jgi:hypothetical protein
MASGFRNSYDETMSVLSPLNKSSAEVSKWWKSRDGHVAVNTCYHVTLSLLYPTLGFSQIPPITRRFVGYVLVPQ